MNTADFTFFKTNMPSALVAVLTVSVLDVRVIIAPITGLSVESLTIPLISLTGKGGGAGVFERPPLVLNWAKTLCAQSVIINSRGNIFFIEE